MDIEVPHTVWARDSHHKVFERIENSNDCGENCNQGATFILKEMKKGDK